MKRIASKNLIDETTTFKPDDNVTRIDVARMLAKMWGLTAPQEDMSITDMTPGTSDYNIVAAVVEKGMMKLQKGSFNPNSTITREEMASIAINSCGVSYKNASNGTPTYSDKDEVSGSYKTDVARTRYIGLMEGVGNNLFMPKALVTRAQAAAVMSRVSDYTGI